jgi:acyl-CoA thioester hydrolase
VPAKPFTWTIRVYYEDTDTGGVVYYANYLKFFERARTEWLRALGFDQQKMADELGVRFIISRIECEYRRPARLDDVIEVDVRIARAGGASILFEQTARRGPVVLANARVRAGCVDAVHLTPAQMPSLLTAAIGESIEVTA